MTLQEFNELYEKRETLAGYVMTACKQLSWQDALDVAEGALLKALARLEVLQVSGAVPWLRKVARQDAWRLCKKRGIEVPLEDLKPQGVDGAPYDDNAAYDPEDTVGLAPDEAILLCELQCEVFNDFEQALQKVPAQQRQVFELVGLGDHSHAEAARVLKVTKGACRIAFFYAKRKLAAELRKYRVLLGTPLFRNPEIGDSEGIIKRILSAVDDLCEFFLGEASFLELDYWLNKPKDHPKRKETLVVFLNRMLSREGLWEPTRFAAYKSDIPADLVALAASSPKGVELAQLNGRLLRIVFRKELEQR